MVFKRIAFCCVAVALIVLLSGCGSSGPKPEKATLTAKPNPIVLEPGQIVGQTTLSWTVTAPNVTSVQILVGSSTGVAMTGGLPLTGTADTAKWVTDGMQFFLQDFSSGDSKGDSRTLATVRVQAQ
jgi:hypothetical protein